MISFLLRDIITMPCNRFAEHSVRRTEFLIIKFFRDYHLAKKNKLNLYSQIAAEENILFQETYEYI